jgi:signal transduction histidine kinase/CheY-like chemotaxis protein
VPIVFGKETIGLLAVANKDGGYTEEDRELQESIANFISPILNARLQRDRQEQERKRAEEEKKKIEAQLIQAQKMESIGTLTGGVAHDFNNILTTIQGYTQLAMVDLKEEDPLYGDLKEIQTASIRASNLTRQLLIFSRKQPMGLIPLNLNETVENLLNMLKRLIGEDITIQTELAPQLWTVMADPGNIEQVMMNLVVNAKDAMPKGGEIRIMTQNIDIDQRYCETYSYAMPGRFVYLSAEDTGTGMDSKILQRIFEPFFSTKEPGKGTGLGLSVVYGIVKQHEGWINAESEPGRGSVFKIYLPATSEKAQEKSKLRGIHLKDIRGKGERVLLVEDDDAIRKMAKKVFTYNDYNGFMVSNVKEAVEIFEREKGEFRLVISDVVLPDGDGLELVERLLSRNPRIQVLLSSGYTDIKSQWPIIQEKGYRFLQKPYSIEDLLRNIREVLEHAGTGT